MSDYELIGLNTATPDLRAPTENDNGKLAGGLLVNRDRKVSGQATNMTDLRSKTGKSGEYIYLQSHTTAGDGGQGNFRWVSGASAGTYTDNNGTIIVPTGGDGSAAWLREVSDEVSVRWFGASPSATASTNLTSFQSAIDYCMGENRSLFVPAGAYTITPGLVALTNGTADSKVLSIYGEKVQSGRNYTMPSRIIFDDDGTTSGEIGLESAYTLAFSFLQIETLAGDARSTGGDFIGVKAPGGSCGLDNVIGLGCAGFAFYLSDIGYAKFRDCIFRHNGTGIGSYLVSWAAATTAEFQRVNGFQNNIVIDASSLNYSIFKECVWEYNQYGVKDFAQNCTFLNCYAENNTVYGAYSNVTRGALILNCFSYAATDDFVASGSTGSFGFDAIGATELSQTTAKTKHIQLYNRSGVLSEVIKASHTAYSGKTIIEDSSGDAIGLVAKDFSKNNDGYADQTIRFMLFNTTVYGTPSGWTITKVGTGLWRIDWPSPKTGDARWPYIFAQGIPIQSTSVGGGQIDVMALVRARDSSSVWSSFQNMNVGFEIRIYTIDPTTGVMTAADEAANVQVTW